MERVMSRTYPNISERNRLPIVPLCCICGAVATWTVTVQVSWFRGEDEDRKVCDEHRSAAADALLKAEPKWSDGKVRE